MMNSDTLTSFSCCLLYWTVLLSLPKYTRSLEMEFGRFIVEPHLHAHHARQTREQAKLMEEDWAFFLGEVSFSLSFSSDTGDDSPTSSPTVVEDIDNPGQETGSPSLTPAPTTTAMPTSTPFPTPTPDNNNDTSPPTMTPFPTVSPEPTLTPTVTAAPTETATPTTTLAPTTTFAPTTSPKPTGEPTVTAQPTTTSAPTPTFDVSVTTPPTTITERAVVFTCTDAGQVALASPPHQTVTAIPFDVAYVAESSASLNQYQGDLEARILADAVQGALNCGPGIFETERVPTVPMETMSTGEACTAQISSCIVLETTFEIVVDETVSTDATAFLGYVRLSNAMPTYSEDIADVDRVEYLRPLLFPPLIDDGDNSTLPPTGIMTGVETTAVSPWTIGAVLAVCIGGATALGVWARNRQRRNEQHIQLLEDMSLGNPEEDVQMA